MLLVANPTLTIGDQVWYRAVVLETAESEASVLFIDYGNCERVPYSNLHPIPDHFLLLPFQITRCSLAGNPTPSWLSGYPESTKVTFY